MASLSEQPLHDCLRTHGSYGPFGRTTKETQAIAGLTPTITFDKTYDGVSRRTSLAAKIGSAKDFINNWTYDYLHRVTQVTQQSQSGGNAVAEKRVDFAYNAISQLTSLKRWSNVAGTATVADTFFTYDTGNRLTDIDHRRNSADIRTYDYTFDNMSRIVTMNSSLDGLATFGYDGQSQLLSADRTGTSNDETYGYDSNGNRNSGSWTSGNNNQLTADGTHTYQYAGEGNRTRRTKTSDGSYTEYTWDYRNRLTKILDKTAGGTITKQADYKYDVFGRRVKKSVDADGAGSGGTVHSWYDGLREEQGNAGDDVVLVFTAASGTLDHRFLHGPAVDQILADEDVTTTSSPGVRLWDLTDHQGTVRDLVDDIGSFLNHLVYDSYGKVISETNSAVDHLFAYTGRERDEESGLQYHRARYYDPSAGRWISEDPLGFEAEDANLARFVRNYPVGLRDPSGLVEEPPTADERAAPLPEGQTPQVFVRGSLDEDEIDHTDVVT